jgi:hypothetical protein
LDEPLANAVGTTRATISAGDALLRKLQTAVLLGAEVRDLNGKPESAPDEEQKHAAINRQVEMLRMTYTLDLGTAVTAGGTLGQLLAVLNNEATA